MSDIGGFILAPDGGGTGITYDTAASISAAKNYAMNDSNVGADKLRKLIKTVEMMADPDMEEHLAKATNMFCELMFDMCSLIRRITHGDDALNGLRLIEALKGLFTMGLLVPVGCPVIELFGEEATRLKAINVGPTDEALATWLAMDMGGEPMEGWLWDEEEKEWRPQMRDASDSSDEEGEAAFLERVARARHRQCDKESYEGLGKVAPQPTKQSGLGRFFGNGVSKTYTSVRCADGQVRQQLGSSSVLQVKTVSHDMGAGKLWSCVVGCGKTFTHGPAKKAHEKVCKYKAKVVDAEEDADDEAEEDVDDATKEIETDEAAAEETPNALPYPFDPPPCEGSNTAAHDAVAGELGIDSSTPAEQYDDLLRANPVVLHRLALTPGLYAVYTNALPSVLASLHRRYRSHLSWSRCLRARARYLRTRARCLRVRARARAKWRQSARSCSRMEAGSRRAGSRRATSGRRAPFFSSTR